MPHRLHIDTENPLKDPQALVAVDRAVADLRRGGILVIRGSAKETALALAAEAATPAALDKLRKLSGGEPVLAVTGHRAHSLGLKEVEETAPAVLLRTEEDLTAWVAGDVADPLAQGEVSEHVSWTCETAPGNSVAAAAIGLVKIARMLPTMVISPLRNLKAAAYPVAWADSENLLVVEAEQIFDYESNVARSLREVSAARVPLDGAEDARIVTFRPADGGIEHLAIVIGSPKANEPVLTRLHSECFTGDLLGSLRCDCGDQLRGAIETISKSGSGVLLYLAQEGRGIGLVNKLRAYELQDTGLDTLDANEQIGFDADERVFLPAAEMLRQMGFSTVRLLTNNPDKVEALARFGITVSERVPHNFPANRHNSAYLRTKADRAGHLL
ncbi:MAG: GTP cyclohydrolase II [Magnetospiraceae bacterium]